MGNDFLLSPIVSFNLLFKKICFSCSREFFFSIISLFSALFSSFIFLIFSLFSLYNALISSLFSLFSSIFLFNSLVFLFNSSIFLFNPSIFLFSSLFSVLNSFSIFFHKSSLNILLFISSFGEWAKIFNFFLKLISIFIFIIKFEMT